MTDKERNSETAGAPQSGKPAGEADKQKAAPETTGDAGKSDKSAWSGDKAAELTAAEFEAVTAERDELKDRLMRAMAEMENIRRRTERDKADTSKYAISNFARDVLSVGDNMRRAIESVPADEAKSHPHLVTLLEGVEMTERELLNVMERHGISRLEPKGEKFDPNLHQAMFEVEDTSVQSGTIVEVVQAGYQIADRVLRPALVGVSKGGPKQARADAPEAKAEPAADPADASKKIDPPKKAETAKAPPAANGDKPKKEPSPASQGQAQKTPLPDPSRSPSAPPRDAGKAKPGTKRPLGGRVDKSA